MELTEEQSQAHQLFLEYREKDPFPDKKPALLNWQDIMDYAESTNMIFPFDKKNLRTASYRLKLLGPYVYWDENGDDPEKPKKGELKEGDMLNVESNSIVFLTLEPLIQLPDYIAARFNLKIDFVYKGFLLGTGPVVDPGFVGHLSFPLHNLTANNYLLEGGSSVAWMEFTKLSPHEVFEKEGKKKSPEDEIKDVPYRKNLRDVWDYMCEAHKELKSVSHKGSIRSSIPKAMADAEKSAREAEKSAAQANKAASWIAGVGIVAVIGLLVAFSIFYLNVASFIKDSTKTQSKMLKEARGQVFELRQEVNRIEGKVDSLATINRSVGTDNANSQPKEPKSTRQPPQQE